MATSLKVVGRKGRYELINTCYEPMGTTHHDRPVWVSRDVQPVYIFHTGKSRWVISRRIDDGGRCYAFVQDSGDQKMPASSGWVCTDSDGEWREDPNIALSTVPSSDDFFVQLRMSLESELTQYGFQDPAYLKQLWKRLDFNGNGIVSLAEIDKMVVEMVAGGSWPAWLNNKPALMRAYKKTILKDGNGDDWVQKREFNALLLNIFWFNKLWQVFEAVDTGTDRRIDVNEFMRGLSAMGLHMSAQQAQAEFAKIDTNHGGQVLFVEFCGYVRKRVHPDDDPSFDADIVSGEVVTKALRRHHGHKATANHIVRQKSIGVFDELEKKIKALMQNKQELLKLWKRIDFNGNHIVSLAEIDKLVVEVYPLLNHKPALMRAYKASIRSTPGDTDDWIEKHEFKALLGNLFYFNKLFWIFDNADGDKDRRLTYSEFKWCLNLCGAKMTEAEIRSDFSKVDKNGGGIILFDEFCLYFTMKACPECLQALTE
eukprot:TRINITY_DN94204_c0_g1_i1.p1 TRINITY_DN94204_c0_g1~~TRINITY_DN94204_c0_g1_i1.p1  ORF type:complete len:484 (-),score=97.96 TRINITY_DN94204_c0_g1_i1:78-1529(-)